MVSRKLMASWAFLDFCLLAAGGICIAFSVIWRKPDVLMNMIISPMDLMGGLALGILLCVTFLVSIGAVVQPNHVTLGFTVLNWFLIFDALVTTVIGTMDWWYTLRQRDEFHQEWLKATPQTRTAIQDMFGCCGYFFANDTSEIGGTHCTSQDFVNQLNQTEPQCVTQITSHSDYTLNNVFTVIYGFMAVILCLFLASMCVIKKRQEDERFKKIDAKRGGRGFV